MARDTVFGLTDSDEIVVFNSAKPGQVLVESTEAFRVELSDPTGGAAIGNFELTTVAIGDHDVAAATPPPGNTGQGRVINGTFGDDNIQGTSGDEVITCGFGTTS